MEVSQGSGSPLEYFLFVKNGTKKDFHFYPSRGQTVLTKYSLVAHQERLMDNLSLTAEERFKKFCKISKLNQQFAQKQIATYIGYIGVFLVK